jgi:hypothetical protein
MTAPKTQDERDREAAEAHAKHVYDQTCGYPSEKEWASLKAHYAFLAGVKYARESEAERVKGLVDALEAIIDPQGLPPIQENIGNRAVASMALAAYRASQTSAGDGG